MTIPIHMWKLFHIYLGNNQVKYLKKSNFSAQKNVKGYLFSKLRNDCLKEVASLTEPVIFKYKKIHCFYFR